MIYPTPLTISQPTLEGYDWISFGSLEVPMQPLRFGFQIDVSPAAPHPDVVFALVARNGSADGLGEGFAVRIDLDRGEIWDLVNDSGLVGWIEHPLGLAAFSLEEPMLLSWEVERIGSVLIPKLQVAGEEWLYPSIRSASEMKFTGLAGCTAEIASAGDFFMHPALWGEQQPSGESLCSEC